MNRISVLIAPTVLVILLSSPSLFAQGNPTDTGLIGDSFRVSFALPDGPGDPGRAREAAVAYNSIEDEYLVVWSGDDETSTIASKIEIYGRRVSGTGELVGQQFRISFTGPEDDDQFDAARPAIVFNSVTHEFFVVWQASQSVQKGVSDEVEVFGQRVNGDSSAPALIRSNMRLSTAGPEGDVSYRAFRPRVAWNNIDNEYLVIWQGNDLRPDLSQAELEVFGQRINADPEGFGEIGEDDFRVSYYGADFDESAGPSDFQIVFNPSRREYVVASSAVGDVPTKEHIFLQRINADPAQFEVLDRDGVQISDSGPHYQTDLFSSTIALALNSLNDEILVVWEAFVDSMSPNGLDVELQGQRISATTSLFEETGENDFQVSQTGHDDDFETRPGLGAVVWNPVANEYLIVWQQNFIPETEIDIEIFGRRFSAIPEQFGPVEPVEFQITQFGSNTHFQNGSSRHPALAFHSARNEFLAVWEGNADNIGLQQHEGEIFGQRLMGGEPLPPVSSTPMGCSSGMRGSGSVPLLGDLVVLLAATLGLSLIPRRGGGSRTARASSREGRSSV